MRCKRTTGCSLNIVGFFPKILESLPPLPRQHSAAIGCTKNFPANRSGIALRALKVFYSDEGEGVVAKNFEKTQFYTQSI